MPLGKIPNRTNAYLFWCFVCKKRTEHRLEPFGYKEQFNPDLGGVYFCIHCEQDNFTIEKLEA